MLAQAFHQGGIALHFAVDFQLRGGLTDELKRTAHFFGTVRGHGAEVGVRQQRDPGRDAEALDFFGAHQRALGNLLGSRIGVYIGIGDEQVLAAENQRVHCAGGVFGVAVADNIRNNIQMMAEVADRTAHHGIGVA